MKNSGGYKDMMMMKSGSIINLFNLSLIPSMSTPLSLFEIEPIKFRPNWKFKIKNLRK